MYRKLILAVLSVFACLGVAPAQAGQSCPPDPKTIKDIQTGAKKHLACEWRKAKALESMLSAMELYLSGEEQWKNAVQKIFNNAEKEDTGFYKAAQGRLDKDKEPSNQGRGAFLEMLTTANLLDDPKMFDHASDLIGKIFETDAGKQALVNADYLFRQEQQYHKGLYELLKAVSNPDQDQRANDLEVLRAAYEKDRDKLVSLVAARISPAK